MTAAPHSFLVVDYHRDSRFLLVKCLQRKFPGAGIYEAEETDTAIEIARRDAIAAIITHRTHDCLGTELIAKFRDVNPAVPIIMVSGIDRTEAALAAGADLFLNYDEWLRLGSVVKELLDQKGAPATIHVAIAPAIVG